MQFLLTAADSWDFASLSGDFNPLHVDPIAARRLQFGGTVCHGIHQMLKALDLAVGAEKLQPVRIQSIAAVFNATLRAGSLAQVMYAPDSANTRARLVVMLDHRPVLTVKLSLQDGMPLGPPPLSAGPVSARPPNSPRVSNDGLVDPAGGAVPVQLNEALAQKLFPNLFCRQDGPSLMADLLASTRIVGMECPGLHSIYSELKLTRRATSAQRQSLAAEPATEMAYSVQRYDARFRSVRISVSGGVMEGTLNAFFRAPPVSQIDFDSLVALVPANSFVGQRALIVGGSRGLGEVVAKVLLAGGAHVTLTYVQGKADAEKIRCEVQQSGRDLQIMQLDVSRPLPEALQIEMAGVDYSHLYYFATPHIASGLAGKWSPTLFDDYCRIYVHGFSALVQILVQGIDRAHPLTVLYPSTVFLDAPPTGFTEYCAAKASGEVLCKHLARSLAVHIHSPRLPRLQTDQNGSFMGVEGDLPLPVILAQLQSMCTEADGVRAADQV